MAEKIEACPWCGEVPERFVQMDGRIAVKCTRPGTETQYDCHAQGPYMASQQNAVAAWNRVARLVELGKRYEQGAGALKEKA